MPRPLEADNKMTTVSPQKGWLTFIEDILKEQFLYS